MARTAKPAAALLASGVQGQRVNEIIASSPAFAQPILKYLRELVREAVPDAAEEIKWGRPFFTVNGVIICQMAAFSRHCGFGFWSPEMTAMLHNEGLDGAAGSGSFGKITSMDDLPSHADLLRYICHAAHLARSPAAAGSDGARLRTSSKAPIAVPPEFADALAGSKQAEAVFHELAPSCRREYLNWIAEAKRPETRQRRTGLAIAMLEQGKRFNEQYGVR